MKPTLDSQQLRVFVTLGRTLSMRRAAEELHLTPSGISHCLKALEDDLGCRLFERTARKFALTKVGRELYTEAHRLVEDMKMLRTRIRVWQDWRQGHLRIGANSTACQFLLPATLREFRESFPDYTILIEQCTSRQAMRMLTDEELDLALLTDPPEIPPNIVGHSIGEDDLQFIVNPLHPWAVKRKAVREDITRGKVIFPERGGNTAALIETYFREEGIRIDPFIEIANEQAIIEFVRLDMGAGILPPWLVANEIEQGLLVSLPLGRRRLKRQWSVFAKKSRQFTIAENLFVKICRNVFRELDHESAET